MMEDVVSCTLSGPKAPNLFRLAYFSTDVVKHLDFAAKSPEDARTTRNTRAVDQNGH